MNFKCPYCKRESNFMEVLAEGDIWAIIQLIPKFGPQVNQNLVFAYCELFGISPMKAHTKKLRHLLEEMAKLFEMESFTYHKKSYRISRKGIADALNEMVHRSFPDNLQNHNYLKKIMIGIAEEEARASGRKEEENLRENEERLKRERRSDEGGRTFAVADILKHMK